MKNLETEENIGKYKIVYSCKSKKYFSCEKPFKTLQEIKLHIQENHRHENIDIYGLTNVPLEKNEKSGRYREISKNSGMSKKPTYTTNNEGQVFLETTEFNKINFTEDESNNSLVKHLKHPLPKENLSKSEISPDPIETTEEILAEGVEISSNDSPKFVCEFCFETFDFPGHLKIHLENRHYKEKSLKKHVKSTKHKSVEIVTPKKVSCICEFCSEDLKTPEALKKHVESEHDMMINITPKVVVKLKEKAKWRCRYVIK